MPWNEPSGGNKDPWNSGGKRNDNGPPNLDEVFKKLQQSLLGFLGGNSKGGGSKGGNNASSGSGFLLGSIIVILLFLYAYKAVFVVDEKERAVILRFGKYVETLGPGLHVYFPPVEERYQNSVTGYRVYKLNQEMLTQDENIVQVALSVQYNIADLRDFELKVTDPVLSLEEATQSALRHAVGSSTMHEVLTEGREILADRVKQRLQSYLDTYQTGLAISRVNVESAQPPKQVQSAFDDVIRAREDEEKIKNIAKAYANQIIPEARGQAQSIIEQANAYKAEVVAIAKGKADRFLNIHSAYKNAPNVTKERLYIDTMESIFEKSSKVLVDNSKSNNVFYLPIDKLMKTKTENNDQNEENKLTEATQGILADKILKDNNQNSEPKKNRSRLGRFNP